MKEHNHATTSNTDEVFRTFINEKIKGMLHHICFTDEYNHVILVFECGWGLVFSDNGSHWTIPPDEVEILKRATKEKIDYLLKEKGK